MKQVEFSTQPSQAWVQSYENQLSRFFENQLSWFLD
jgi:hypothetical protein